MVRRSAAAASTAAVNTFKGNERTEEKNEATQNAEKHSCVSKIAALPQFNETIDAIEREVQAVQAFLVLHCCASATRSIHQHIQRNQTIKIIDLNGQNTCFFPRSIFIFGCTAFCCSYNSKPQL